MICYCVRLCTLLALSVIFLLCTARVDFDTAMGKGTQHFGYLYKQCVASTIACERLAQLRTCFNEQHPDEMQSAASVRIPKIIHQIWLGSPVPEKFKAWIASWKKHHPTWEYKLWTEKEIAGLGLENQQWYDAAVNYAERSDVARYEILYRFGGVYVDTDFECVKPLDDLHYRYDCYVGLEPPALAPFLGHLVIINNGFIGACPGHPLMRACIDAIPTMQHEKDIVLKTGPVLLTNLFFKLLEVGDTNAIALPASYFYPVGKEVKERSSIERCIQQETYGIHHWAGSWIFNPAAFIPGFRFRIVTKPA